MRNETQHSAVSFQRSVAGYSEGRTVSGGVLKPDARRPSTGPIMLLRAMLRMRWIVAQIPAHVFVRSRELNVRFRSHALAG